jgi:hypothetical protein
MMRKRLEVVLQVIPFYLLKRPHNPRVETGPLFMEQSPIYDFIGEGMFERVFHLGEEITFVQELGRLKAHQIPVKFVVQKTCNRAEQTQRNDHADDSGSLQQVFLL